MRCTMSVAQMMDTIQECLIVKSGMYLDYNEIKKILESFEDDISEFILNNTENCVYGLRPEELEFVINSIRKELGELSDTNPFPMMSLLKEHPEYQDEMMLVAKSAHSCLDWHRKSFGNYEPLGDEFINKLIQVSGVSKRMAVLFLLILTRSLDRSFSYLQPTKKWDGIILLSDLFDSKKLPDLPDVFFDQRYIDYLSNHTDALYDIHWRQFEGLTAEFFSRNGFDVKIGTGSKDGGIDIFATHKDTNAMIIIQCKRYSKNNLVKVNAVKALYFDTIDNGASGALLATTSHLSPAGKEITARNYSISAAEHESIVRWVKSMKSNYFI